MMEHFIDPNECWFIRDDTHLFTVITYSLEEGWWETVVLEKGHSGPLEIHRWDNHRQSITGHAVVWKRVTDKEKRAGW